MQLPLGSSLTFTQADPANQPTQYEPYMELNLNPLTVDCNGLTEFPAPRLIRQISVYRDGVPHTNDICCDINDDRAQHVDLGNGSQHLGRWFDTPVSATCIRVYGLATGDHLSITYETP